MPEPLGGAHRAPEVAHENLAACISRELDGLEGIPLDELVASRKEKFRQIGSIEGRFPRVD